MHAWLAARGLSAAADALVANGYDDLSDLALLDDGDLDAAGIDDEALRARILAAVAAAESGAEPATGHSSANTAITVMTTEHPVQVRGRHASFLLLFAALLL